MKIKLKDSIHPELTAIGLRTGMLIESNDVNKTTGAVQFTKWYNGFTMNCVIWPEDYEIVSEEKTVTIAKLQSDIANDISIPVAELTNTLDAMYWCFSPFLGNSDLSESPWIENLIKSYNSIVSTLPAPWNLQYEPVEY